MTTGCIAWVDDLIEHGTYDANGQAYNGSDPDNAGTESLSESYRFVGTTTAASLRVDFTARSIRIVGLSGIETASGNLPDPAVSFNFQGFFSGGSVFNLPMRFDAIGGTWIYVLSSDQTIDNVRIRPATSLGETWVGFGRIWAGSGLILGSDALVGAEWQPGYLQTDRRRVSRGGQVDSEAGARIRTLDFGISRASGIAKLDRSVDHSLASFQAGASSPIMACLRSDVPQTCFYGKATEIPTIDREPGDRFGFRLKMQEIF